jgi:hypothetical protein
VADKKANRGTNWEEFPIAESDLEQPDESRLINGEQKKKYQRNPVVLNPFLPGEDLANRLLTSTAGRDPEIEL